MIKQVVLCVPVYNSERTLARTLETLISQDYPIYKIKVFDNQSTDNSQNIVLDFKKRFPFIDLHVNEVNVGGEGNFSICTQAAEGDYCAIVHADDLYEKNFVSSSIDVLEKNPDCVATFCSALEIDANEAVTGERLVPTVLQEKEITILNSKELLNLVFKYGNFITCPSVMVRTHVYKDQIKAWRPEVCKTSADLDVWLRLSSFGNLAFIRKNLMRYRVADASYSFRVAKKRTTKHDLFLVIDCYKNDSNISDYNFLALKDQSIRSLNIFRNKKREVCFPNETKFDLALIVRKMCQSKWHFKMGLALIAIKVLVIGLILVRWNRGCKR